MIKKVSSIHTNKEVPTMKFAKNQAFIIFVNHGHHGKKLSELLRYLSLDKINFVAMKINGETATIETILDREDTVELFLDEPEY